VAWMLRTSGSLLSQPLRYSLSPAGGGGVIESVCSHRTANKEVKGVRGGAIRKRWLGSLPRAPLNTWGRSASRKNASSHVMTSRTFVAFGSCPSAVARAVRSRSVKIPTIWVPLATWRWDG